MSEEDQAAPPRARDGGAATREYVVLEQVVYEEGDNGAKVYCWLESHRVIARNSNNALRKAFKEMREDRTGDGLEPFDQAMLEVVPASYWHPTEVRTKRRESITVAVGE
jgi:hypothetical protein